MVFNVIKKQDILNDEFYQLPKGLYLPGRYTSLSNDAKTMYAILRSQMKLSEKNDWIDSDGAIYFTFSTEKLMEILNCSKPSITKYKKQLISVGLLSEKRTGRTNRMYLGHLTYDDISSCDFNVLNVIEDTTQHNNIEHKKRIMTLKKQDKETNQDKMFHREVKNFNISKKMFHREVKKFYFTKKMFHREVKKFYFTKKTASNQYSDKHSDFKMLKNFTSEVKKFNPRYNKLNILDNQDNILDQATDETTNVSQVNIKQNVSQEKETDNVSQQLVYDAHFQTQYLYDIQDQYHPKLYSTLCRLSSNEDVQMIHRMLRNAADDIYKQRYQAFQQARRYSECLQKLFVQVTGYQDEGVAEAVANALVRAIRYYHGGETNVQHVEGYYYTVIMRAIVTYLVETYELEPNEGEDIVDIPIVKWKHE